MADKHTGVNGSGLNWAKIQPANGRGIWSFTDTSVGSNRVVGFLYSKFDVKKFGGLNKFQ